MKPLINLFWRICLFQKGPEDVPYSLPLLVLLLGLSMGFSAVLIYALNPAFIGPKLMGGGLALMCWLLIVYGLLSLRKAGSRWVQAISACLGSDLVVGVLIIPLQWLILSGPESGVAGFGQAGLLTVMIWDILIKGRIYESAMGLERLQANVVSIFIWLTVWVVSLSFLPAEAFQQQ